MAKCKVCGFPVYRGNIKLVGRDKKHREHVSCEKAKEKQAQSGSLDKVETNEPKTILETAAKKQASLNKLSNESETKLKEIVKIQPVKPMSLNIKKPMSLSERKTSMFSYRLFIRKYDAEKLSGSSKPVRIEVIPVLSSEVDNNPEGLNEYTEIKLEG